MPLRYLWYKCEKKLKKRIEQANNRLFITFGWQCWDDDDDDDGLDI